MPDDLPTPVPPPHDPGPPPRAELSWKVIALTLVVCYLLPGIVMATILAVIKDTLSLDAWKVITGVLSLIGFLVPPLTGGFLAARYAKTLVWRHVLIVGVLGALMSLLAFRSTPRAMVLYALASVALAAFGAYFQRQGQPKR